MRKNRDDNEIKTDQKSDQKKRLSAEKVHVKWKMHLKLLRI